MSLDGGALAQLLQPHTGSTDPTTGAPAPSPTTALTNYAKGYAAMLQGAIVACLLPTGQGTAPPGSPVQLGQISGCKFITVIPATMIGIASIGALPTAVPGLILECTAIATYLMTSAVIGFTAGTVKGTSTATTETPGILAAGNASGGAIAGLVGASLAQAVSAATLQTGPHQIDFYTELCNYTMTSGMVTFGPNLITGVCSPAGKFLLGLSPGGGIVS